LPFVKFSENEEKAREFIAKHRKKTPSEIHQEIKNTVLGINNLEGIQKISNDKIKE